MSIQETFLCNEDPSITLINACYALTEQHRMILSSLGKEHMLTENEMLVLVHLALNPDARTQKKLQTTNLHLSVSSICRMVESLRKKGYLTTELDEKDRRSRLIHVQESGMQLAEAFRQCLHRRLDDIFNGVPMPDFDQVVKIMSKATAVFGSRPLVSRLAAE